MSKNSGRICICFRPDELEIFDELCLKKGYFRSTFIREILMFCASNNFSPVDVWKMFREYKQLRKYVDAKKSGYILKSVPQQV